MSGRKNPVNFSIVIFIPGIFEKNGHEYFFEIFKLDEQICKRWQHLSVRIIMSGPYQKKELFNAQDL
jgi:hypothetical protein